ncbi:hydroxyacylglutathione hydrolase [Thalassotalea sp. HSM 43]|uniref:hydroxyacylglutathione hydrolase n=1 Tax=Thalassotalea sp. HSM 43 TaxID=2552945 RepID=UPI0010801DD7|nr:hydroxyacylglutathione hydrolase [Thalassotalea sp. HSM 43]QBY02972.1 hydroxyacylglutathione hydrolase [Thalassotalea sp. HSM 43]
MFQVHAIAAFNDNYIWCITDSASAKCALVDPGDGDVCIEFIKKNNLILSDILVTHHHKDHTGGINKLKQFAHEQDWPVTVYGPTQEAQQFSDVHVVEGEAVQILTNQIHFSVIELPGHTLGHIAFHNDQWLFCGDTLFSGGCGRLFEGSAQQMLNSLQKLSTLNEQTKVFCAHEYTLANLKFARTIEPNNGQLKDYLNKATELRASNIATIPSTIGLEKQINPFLRSHLDSVRVGAQQQSGLELDNTVDVFAAVRELKDNF